MSIFAEKVCHFSLYNISSVYSLNHHITFRFETRQALIYQLVLSLTGENGNWLRITSSNVKGYILGIYHGLPKKNLRIPAPRWGGIHAYVAA